MKLQPDALNLPIVQTTPACHTATKRLRLDFPQNLGSRDKLSSVEDGIVMPGVDGHRAKESYSILYMPHQSTVYLYINA